jgi:hypothetical protein
VVSYCGTEVVAVKSHTKGDSEGGYPSSASPPLNFLIDDFNSDEASRAAFNEAIRATEDAAATGSYCAHNIGYDDQGGTGGFALHPVEEFDVSELFPKEGEVSTNLLN